MSKKVAVIDLGSNSVRLAIFERTSRLGFYVVGEYKVKIRLGEGAYENGGMLTKSAMDKCFLAFSDFKKIISDQKISRVLCIGTSALRDAPNANEFISKIRRELGLNLRKITGEDEAKYGALAVNNLIAPLDEFCTIDIGGGSTELTKIKNGKIIDQISLNLGTVRLKELFFDRRDLSGCAQFVGEAIGEIPAGFQSQNLVTIGGSLRAISSAIMEKTEYPLKILHNFSYKFDDFREFIAKIQNANPNELEKFDIKKERFDTIRQGAMIFLQVAQFTGAKRIFTSGVGIREGVFLSRILGENAKFPANFNPSLKSLLDRFALRQSFAPKLAKELFLALAPLHKISPNFLMELTTAAKIAETGTQIDYYENHINSAYLAISCLNYGYTHEQKALIAALIRINGKRNTSAVNEYKFLLPKDEILIWLSFILKFSMILDRFGTRDLQIKFENRQLFIDNSSQSLLLRAEIEKLNKPIDFEIFFTKF